MSEEKSKGKPSDLLHKLAVSIGVFVLGGAAFLLFSLLCFAFAALFAAFTELAAIATGLNLVDIRQGLVLFAFIGGASVFFYWQNRDE